jgi:hypothetical protein
MKTYEKAIVLCLFFNIYKLLIFFFRVKGWNPFEDSVNFGAMSEDNIFGKKSALKKLGRRAK